MTHLSEEELVEHYFESPPGRFLHRARWHLTECGQCATAYARLANDLTVARPLEVPDRGADYGEQMWRKVAPLLPELSTEQLRPPRLAQWRRLTYAAGLAVLIAGAFCLGRMGEHRRQPPIAASKTPPPVQQHVVVVVLGDHLDRSERLLVELKHADAENPEMVAPLRDEARSLLPANRVFREDADKSGDQELMQALDRLDPLLNQLANQTGRAKF